jgi:hypothetical protein
MTLLSSAAKERAERLAVHQGGGPDDPHPRKSKAGTYHQIAETEFTGDRGRWTARERSTVIGSEPVTYPKLPDASPWANNPVGQEPPLGFSIDALEPTGTHVEVEQSLQALGEAGCPSSGEPDDGVDAPLSPAPGERRASRRTSRKA